MFGQNKTGFGASSTTFGQPNAFGSTPFGGGTNTSSAFGAKPTGTSTFGTSGGFGSTNTTQTGLFGSSNQTTGGGLFGGTATPGGFGQNTNLGFGGVNPQTSQASGGIFGQTTQTSNIFGTPSASAFGAKTPAQSTFGATQNTGGLFGSTPASSALFGGASSSTGGGLFGAGAFGVGNQQQQAGTVVKFNPPMGNDSVMKGGVSQNIKTKHQCITAMKEYENKSLEELRMEDYAANRKGPQAGATGTVFGAQNTQQNTGFGFNQQQAKPTGFGFGTSTNNNPTTGAGLFGTTQQNTGLFGNAGNKTLFGASTTTTASTGFSFGQTNTSQAGGLFGAQQKSLFGTPSTQSQGGLFGQTQQQAPAFGTSGSFGTFGTTTQAQQSTGLFGANKPAFGTATSTAGSFGFGQQQSAGGLFGSKPATTGAGFNFGQTGNTGFGATQGGGLFAKPGGFGSSTGTLGTTGFGAGNSLFSGQQNKPALGTGFGSTNLTGLGGNTLGAGLNLGNTNTALSTGTDPSGALLQQAQIQQQLLALSNSPYGDSPLFKNLKPDGSKRDAALKPTNPSAQKAALNVANQYKVSPRPVAKIKPKLLQSLNSKSQLFDGLDDEESAFGNDTFVPRKSIKNLVIKTYHSSNSSQLNKSENRSASETEADIVAPSPIMTSEGNANNEIHGATATPLVNQSLNMNGETDLIRGRKTFSQSIETTPVRASYRGLGLDDTITALNARNRSHGDPDTSPGAPGEDKDTSPPHPLGIKLTRPGYYTIPSLEELATKGKNEDGQCLVDGFVVGREGYGNVFFQGITNIVDLDLDSIVHFRRKEITVYPDDDKKPEVGDELNKKAQVTLDCVWPTDKTTHTTIKSPERLSIMAYQEKIEQATNRIGAKFIDYRQETGSWVFEVKHFSKYGLLEDSDDEGEPVEKDAKNLKILKIKTQQQLAIQKKKINQETGVPEENMDQLAHQPVESSGQIKQAELNSEQMIGQSPQSESRFDEGEEQDEDEDSNMEDLMQEEMPEGMENASCSDMSDGQDQIPSSHRLTSLGISSQKVQVMKASFFGDEDDMDIDSAMNRAETKRRGLGGPLIKSAQSGIIDPSLSDTVGKKPRLTSALSSVLHVSPKQPPVIQRSFVFDRQQLHKEIGPPVMKPFHQKMPDHIILPSGLEGPEKTRKPVGSRIQRAIPSLEDSVIANKEQLIMDAGLYRGRACRVGWGPRNSLVHCGKPISLGERDATEKTPILPKLISTHRRCLNEAPFEVVIEKINITGYSTEADPALKNMLEKTLEIQLKHSQMTLESGSPVFVPTIGSSSLHRCAEQAAEDEERLFNHPFASTIRHSRMVWDLCVSLWGKLNQFMDQEPDQTSHDLLMARREAFSRWLSSTVLHTINMEINVAKTQGSGHLPCVKSYMTGRMVSEACALSQDCGDHRLALLLSQSAGSSFTRQLITRQLAKWEELKADTLIDQERLKLYAMLAGAMVWPSSQGDLNVCENLDWKRCLAVHLWYKCPPTATVAEALRMYDSALDNTTEYGRYASLPLPPYLEETVDKLYNEELDGKYAIRDTCYHLLKLHADRSYRLERILTPTTSTPNHLDFTLSWHLMQVLKALQYTHLPSYSEANVTAGFAAQLEALGLWHWAVFVLLHIDDNESRENTVRELLGRHVSLSRDADYVDREHFILERLEVPPVWIHEAKAQRARSEGRYPEEAWHLLKAGRFNQAHRILLRHVAADAVISERYGYLKRYLREMAPPEYSSTIQDWATGGKVFLDYVTMVETLDEIRQGDLNSYELERLQPEVTSLCSRIEHVPCYTAKDRLCQSDMAKRTANLLRMLLLLQQSRSEPNKSHISTRLIAPHIAKLPLPEDYALQELRQLTRAHMIEMTS